MQERAVKMTMPAEPVVPVPQPISRVPVIGALVVSIMILAIFGFAYGVCLYFKITDQISSFGQAAINMAMIAVGYWLGSSSGSEKKSDTIATMRTPPAQHDTTMIVPPTNRTI
jgi:hypothetical protein